MLWFLRRGLLPEESWMLITVTANSGAVFLTHTGNSSTPGSQHMVLAILVVAALFLSHMVETEQSPWLDPSHQPLADLLNCTSPHTEEENSGAPERRGLTSWSCPELGKLCSGQLRLKDSQEREISDSFRGQKTYGNAKRWQIQRAWKLGHLALSSLTFGNDTSQYWVQNQLW